MKKAKPELPFAEVLQSLEFGEPINIALLYRLSDMESADHEAFFAMWRRLNAARRRLLVRHLADLMETNFEVEFGPIFAVGIEDEDAGVRLAALEGLWDSSDTKLVPRIVRLLEGDQDDGVRVAAARALAHFVLMVEWGQIPPRFKPAIVAALLGQWDRPDVSLPLKRATLEALAASAHPRVSEMIREAYGSGDLSLQLSALFAMGYTADPRWISTIKAELESPYDEMRMEAARAAGNLGRSDSVEQLREMIDDPELEVQLAVIDALAQIGSEEASEILNEILEDEEAGHLHEAVEEALAEMSVLQLNDFTLFDFAEEEEDPGGLSA